MSASDVTNWTLIRDAAQGHADAREVFAWEYEPVVRAYFGARWRRSPLAADVDDAIQDVFVECFRQRGVLARADPQRLPGVPLRRRTQRGPSLGGAQRARPRASGAE